MNSNTSLASIIPLFKSKIKTWKKIAKLIVSESQRTVVSPHEPALKPKAFKRASDSSTQVTAFEGGFKIANAQKNKINLCFVGRLVQIDYDMKI